ANTAPTAPSSRRSTATSPSSNGCSTTSPARTATRRPYAATSPRRRGWCTRSSRMQREGWGERRIANRNGGLTASVLFLRLRAQRATQFAPYCRFLSLAAGDGGGGGGGGAACEMLLAPNRTRVGLRSKLFTARLMSESVLRPS